MNYAPHTFELTLTPNTENFQKQKNKAYKNAKGTHKMFQDGKNFDKYIDTALTDEGVKIEYHDGTYKKRIKLIVNPTRMLSGDDVKKLWKPNRNNISKLLCKLESEIENYFDSKYSLDDFRLTRMDFTVNIDVGSRETVAAYIKILHKLGKVKGFHLKYSRHDNGIDKDLSFDLEGNSNGVEFTAYDKEAASKRKEARGILRVEIRLTRPKTISEFTRKSNTSKQIEDLALHSKDIFLATFTHVVPCGDHYKKKDAVKIVETGIAKKKLKEKMLRLLELIPKKKSLYLAQKEMKERNIARIMTQFAEINVSPITISKGHKVSHLKGLYVYLCES